MQIHRHAQLFSPSDLVAFMGCRHRTALDLRKLGGWDAERVEADAAARLVQDYGDRHERAYLEVLAGRGLRIARIDTRGPIEERVAATRQAMSDGMDVVYQAALLQAPWIGYADFLLRVPGASRLGEHHYEIADTKLAKSNRAKFMVQLCVYADLLAHEQGVLPRYLHVVLGQLDAHERARRGLPDGADHVSKLPTADYIHYTRAHAARFLAFVSQPAPTQPVPVPACQSCGWREHCGEHWRRGDHLSQVAGIRARQIARLEAAGVTTMHALARTEAGVEGIGPDVLAKLKSQAALQCTPTGPDGRPRHELIAPRADADPAKPTGFALLPKPDPGDLYFDMEGFPHVPGGLEYLFGVGYREDGEPARWTFRPFWAHDRRDEKLAFEQFMDFIEARLARYPGAHIYHYAPYERTAIKKLSSLHDTRVELRDRLLREGRLVDLYRVVTSALRLALPSYSIKKVEACYRGQRQGEVANAGDSIVQYEAYRNTEDAATRQRLLADIEAYNRDDVESTRQLHDWLESLRPADTPRFVQRVAEEGDEGEASTKRRERAEREAAVIARLAAWAQAKPEGSEEHARASRLAEIVGQSLGFYWRCRLPGLWRHYERQTVEESTLLDDQDCLAMLEQRDRPTAERRSVRYHYRVPEQPTKIGTGSPVRCLTDGLPASNLLYDEETGSLSFTRAAVKPAPPPVLTLVLDDQVSQEKKLEAIYRYAEHLCTGAPGHEALAGLLARERPRLAGRPPGATVVDEPSTPAITAAVRALDGSHLVIQGPPGTGKTTTASQVIAALIAEGRRVAISSNSHAAINHLLAASVRRCAEAGTRVQAVVVKRDENLPDDIEDVEPAKLDSQVHRLVGGTAFLLCRPEQVGKWDYLFIDEASQVSLADVIAAGPCARNIVLLGDQMQLPQPTEGTHPGESGLSALDYLMQGRPTVPPDEGIFLATTYRMHPDVCRPVSEGIYEGRLQPADACRTQRLRLGPDADPALRETGVVHVGVEHRERSQSCPEEVERVAGLYRSLLRQQWTDDKGRTAPVTADDIVVLAAYNAQVRALQARLGPRARVGTVDKFQGQEAAVALLSMTSSDADSMPRGVDFLFSRHRLNVAVSRARCLAVIVASPALGEVDCEAIEGVPLLSFYMLLTKDR